MRAVRYATCFAVLILLLGCGKSSKLAQLLPDAPNGWKTDGRPTNHDVSGVGHSSARSYVPTGSAASLGVERVTVQILLSDKDTDPKQLTSMSLASKAEFKEQIQVAGFPAYASFPMPDNDTHSLDIMPRKGTYVEIVAYKGGAGWEKTENRESVVSAFSGKIDLKKISVVE